MKRYGFAVLTLALILCASAAFAIFPGQTFGLYSGLGDGYLAVQLQQGWAHGQPAWYSCFATNDIRWAQTQNITLAPKLRSAANDGSLPMYVITNFSQGPVFSRSPVVGPYSGIWTVTYITWRPGVTPWVITNASAPSGAPPGLPSATQALYTLTNPVAPPVSVINPTVLDCPIFAIGQISNPWRLPNMFAPPYRYRIPQATYVNTYTRQLTVPFWNVYCDDPITRRIMTSRVIIPDVSDPALSRLIGANYAPELMFVNVNDRQSFFAVNWAQDYDPRPGIQPVKVLTNQFPVLEDCPTSCTWRNTNYGYSPVDTFVLLQRNVNIPPFPPLYPPPYISPEVLLSTDQFIVSQIMTGALRWVPYPTPPLPAIPLAFPFPPGQGFPAVNAPVVCSGLF